VKQLRVAVIGAGRLGAFHAQKLAAEADAQLVAVVDPIPDRRRQVAEACHTRPLADYHRLLGRIDAAIVAAPTREHYRIARELLLADVHLLVEKPICRSLVEAEELVELARRRGLVLQVGHVERFNPAFVAVAGRIGRPKYVEAVRAGPFTFRSTDVGVVLDLMIHDIDLLLTLLGSSVRRVDALGLSVLGGYEDAANARLHFSCGCVATLSACRVSHLPARRMTLWSLDGFAALDFVARSAEMVRPSTALRERRLDVQALTPEQADHYRTHLADEHLPRERLQFEPVDALALQMREFLDSVRGRCAPRADGRAACRALAVAERILACIDRHAWDNLPDGLVGPMALPQPRVIPTPLTAYLSGRQPTARREAG